MSTPDQDPEREKRTSEILGEALGGAARRAGLDPAESSSTHKVVWSAMGGWRGILESVLPSLAFVIIFTIRPEPLILSLGVSVGLAAVFTVVRLLQKSPPSAALGGLIAAVAAAALALWTGRGADNFVPGLITNAVYGSVILVSALIGWSLIGLAVGFLMGEGTTWRSDRRKRRAYFWLGIAWAALFFARLAVQLPLYLAGDVTALGTLKLVMGLPLFAPLIAVTWLVVRALHPREPAREDASEA
ncbi:MULTISPECIES: DUF3159 domain-containing protein [Microbacterium]|uniref:DUF3159 domain-containing protein n=1 Tax=Microbacterium aurugineum TaxID=2851642 RepID=A0ABY4J1H9_9MICO|nr:MULTISPECIES: DUF3159 domain-containing protein [Microbacterium]MCE0507744.1 DUF3159 domain-containing protein [Microbacterium sp. KKR3/1]MCK8477681.1 DUF3159 domain-containing protein [Microbacterium aurugineum]MCZ4300958.1 DUF3159 domain-containing protein [Microbacterium oxydans]QEA29663.1 DUF3159 domain-containing protein [Microbacterium sp. CBA3102]TFB18124.1 DUF3159 domain-containing protein [Microbacterium sp. 3H14]